MEEMSEEIQRLRKELSIERQLNVKLTEEVNKLRDQMTDSRGDRSTMGSTVGTHVTGDSVGNKLMVRFKCLAEECDHRFMSKTSLIEHMINGHQMEDIYECEECDDLCLSEEALIGHKHRAHTSATVVSTRETSDGLATESSLQRHIHETNALNGIQIFETENDAEEQVSESNGSTSSSYEVIIDSDNSDDNDSDYMDAIDDQSGGFRCDYNDCHKVFTESKAYRRHRLTHLADKSLKCPLNDCDYRCDRRFQLREHMNERHEGVDQFPCPHDVCGELFLTADALKLHIDSDIHRPIVGQSSSKRVFKCDFIGCELTFKRKDGLNRHRFIHTGKPLKCPYDGCDYRCVKTHDLTIHTNRHLGLRPFACAVDECGKTFVSKSHFKRHQLVHSNERPFRCPHCHKRFKTRSHLVRHQLEVHDKSGHK
ncbi:unnamed protein product, partial [Medioppia subpectinata]